MGEKHIATPDELIGAGAVENGLGIDHLAHAECYTAREVGFDQTCDDICRRTLGGNDHVHAHGTRLLGDTCYWLLDFLAGSHDKIGELVDNHYYVREVAVAFLRIQALLHETLVVVKDGAFIGIAQQEITLVHLHTQRVEGGKHLVH